MPTDDRVVLEVLKFELDFIEKGGYGRSVRTPWLPTSIFKIPDLPEFWGSHAKPPV
jgi:hypothetical protein